MRHTEALTSVFKSHYQIADRFVAAPHLAVIGTSSVMCDVRDLARKGAKADVAVLLRGETGTGKDLFARAIHAQSGRRKKPFITYHCATL